MTTETIDLTPTTVRKVLSEVLAQVRDDRRIRARMNKEDGDFRGVLCMINMKGRAPFFQTVGSMSDEELEYQQRLALKDADELRMFGSIDDLNEPGFIRNQFAGAVRFSEDVLCFGGALPWLVCEFISALIARRLGIATVDELKHWFASGDNPFVPTDPKDPLYLF